MGGRRGEIRRNWPGLYDVVDKHEYLIDW
jgi:hypothetical protein